MGEAKKKSLKRADILSGATRCVYCERENPTTVEHMPPRGMFKGKDRPSGWEFACCERCNSGSKIADTVAQLFALCEPVHENEWKITQITQLAEGLRRSAPSIADDLGLLSSSPSGFFKDAKPSLLNQKGVIHPVMEGTLGQGISQKHLDVFSAKMAMAAFFNYLNRPVGLHGIIFTQWFLNTGIPMDAYHAFLAMMAGYDQLTQGKKVSTGQFDLHYNTDGKSLVAAVICFHGSLSIILFVTDGSEFLEPFHKIFANSVDKNQPGNQLVSPGLSNLEALERERGKGNSNG